MSRIHGHIMIEQYLALTYLYTFYFNNILVRIELDIITKTYDRNYGSKFQCNLTPYHNNSVQKISALIDISKGDDTITKLKLNRIHLKKRINILGLPYLFCFRLFFLSRRLFCRCLLNPLLHHPCTKYIYSTYSHIYNRRKWRKKSKECYYSAYKVHNLRKSENLLDKSMSKIRLSCALGYKNTCCK